MQRLESLENSHIGSKPKLAKKVNKKTLHSSFLQEGSHWSWGQKLSWAKKPLNQVSVYIRVVLGKKTAEKKQVIFKK